MIIILFIFNMCLASSVDVIQTDTPTLSPKSVFYCTLSKSQNNAYSTIKATMFLDPSRDLKSLLNYSFSSQDRSTQLISTFRYNGDLRMRVDTSSEIILRTDLVVNMGDLSNKKIMVDILTNKKTKITVYFQMNTVSGLKLGSLPYFYQADNNLRSLNVYFQTFTERTSNKFNLDFNFLEILRNLCQLNLILQCNQYIQILQYRIINTCRSLDKIETISFSSSIYITRTCKTQTSDYVDTGLSLALFKHEVDSNLDASQYANTSWALENRTLVNFYLFDYKLKADSGTFPIGDGLCSKLKAFSYLSLGFISLNMNFQATFPIDFQRNHIFVNLSYGVKKNNFAKAEVCAVIILRNDYSVFLKQFKNGSATTIEINVCPWSNVNPEVRGIIISQSSKTIGANSYEFFDYGNVKYFIQQNSQTISSSNRTYGFTNRNISSIIENLQIPTNYVIATVRQGFRVYCGQINFTLSISNINIIFNPFYTPPPQTPTPPIIPTLILPPPTTPKPSSPYSITPQTRTTTSNILGIPDIGLLLRLVQFLNLLDDLSYFIYHNTTYDAAFTFISDLSWGWVHAKWTPPEVVQREMGFNLSSGAEGWVEFRPAQVRFRVKGERMAFIDNCRGFMLYTVPFSLVVFYGLWRIYWRFESYKVVAIISPFSSWAYLAVSLICDNSQYLAFRAFQQLQAPPPTNGIFLLSQILALIGLFLSVFGTFAIFLLTHSFAHHLFKPPILLRLLPSYQHLCLWTCTRFLAGYIHASINDPLVRISLLVSLQFIVTLSSILSWPYSRLKTPHSALIFGQIARLVLYLLICLQVVFPELTGQLEGKVSEMSFGLIQAVFFSNALQIVLTVVVGAFVNSQQIRGNKIAKEIQPVNGKVEEIFKEEQKLKQSKKVVFQEEFHQQKQNKPATIIECGCNDSNIQIKKPITARKTYGAGIKLKLNGAKHSHEKTMKKAKIIKEIIQKTQVINNLKTQRTNKDSTKLSRPVKTVRKLFNPL